MVALTINRRNAGNRRLLLKCELASNRSSCASIARLSSSVKVSRVSVASEKVAIGADGVIIPASRCKRRANFRFGKLLRLPLLTDVFTGKDPEDLPQVTDADSARSL